MAKIFPLKDIEARKRALIAESEVYRQMLSLEVQNIRLYGVRLQRKFALVRLANPLLLLAGSFLGLRFLRTSTPAKRRGKWSRLFGASLLGWRLFRRFGPLLQGALSQRIRKRAPVSPEERTPAANI